MFLLKFLKNIIVQAPNIPQFKSLEMGNVQYELKIVIRHKDIVLHCTEVGFASFLSTFFCISMYKQMEAIFVSFWYLILTTLKEICGNLRFFELIGF